MELIDISKVKKTTSSRMRYDSLKRGKLKLSIKTHGQLKPLVVDSYFNLIEGHNVYDALSELGIEKVWVVIPNSNKTSNQIYAELNLLQSEPQPIKMFECFKDSDLENNALPFSKQDLTKFVNMLNFDPTLYKADRKNPGVEYIF